MPAGFVRSIIPASGLACFRTSSTYSSTRETVGSAEANPPGLVVCCPAFADMKHAFRGAKGVHGY